MCISMMKELPFLPWSKIWGLQDVALRLRAIPRKTALSISSILSCAMLRSEIWSLQDFALRFSSNAKLRSQNSNPKLCNVDQTASSTPNIKLQINSQFFLAIHYMSFYLESKSQGVGRWAPAATRFIACGPNFPFIWRCSTRIEIIPH